MTGERCRTAGVPGRTGRRVLAVLGGGLLLAGCASMPDSGSVRPVPLTEKREDQQVRTYAEPPEKDATPQHIVSGFLEALVSDDYATVAKAYLAKDSRGWKPLETTVLAEAPDAIERGVVGPKAEGEEARETRIELQGEQIATVDLSGAYSPDEHAYSTELSLVQEGKSGQWRISSPPRGLVMGRSDFVRTYESANTYYFTERSRSALVADPVFVRRRIDPVTDVVNTLLDGPGGTLEEVAQTTFPRGTRLAQGERLEVDKEGMLRVRLRVQGRPGVHACERMAAQVLHTVRSQEGVRVDSVDLVTASDSRLCSLTSGAGAKYAPGRLEGEPQYQYFVDGKHRLARLSATNGTTVEPIPVLGPFGEGKPAVGAAAVSRSEDEAAAVSENGKSMYVSSLRKPAELGNPAMTSGGEKRADGLTAPSWDGLGDLWVADRVGDRSRLYWLRGGVGEPEEIVVPELAGRRVESLRMSADGSRIAVVVSEGDDRRLLLGAVTVEDDRPVVTGLEENAPQLQDVRALAWAGEGRLVVVGKQGAEGVQQMSLVSTDGSVSTEVAQGLTGVTAVAASEDGSKPLLAASEEGIVLLPPNAYWTPVPGGSGGTAPVYPG